MTPVRVLLVSTYELGHQPLGLAAPAAALRASGHEVRCFDLAVESPEPAVFAGAELVGISVPMHTAARLGIALARRVRAVNPSAHICFYGLYASPLAGLLVESGVADSVAGGEYEPALCALASGLSSGDDVRGAVRVAFERQRYPVPDRSGLPPLERYARLLSEKGPRLAGYVEASRGCAHRCTHCPITPVYGGRLRLVQAEAVLADIDQQVAMGAQHITFGDPDFLNAPGPSLEILGEAHRRHPTLTFDVTVKVEHLLEHRRLLPPLRDRGCLFLTSAFESCSDEVLRLLDKGHTRADMVEAVRLTSEAGIALRPTWVAFTPWGGVDDFLALLAFVEDNDLVESVQPVQYGLRLLLPPGSPLVEVIGRQGLLGGFDEEHLTYQWKAGDARIDALQREVACIVECGASAGESNAETFARVRDAALRAAGRPPVASEPRTSGRFVPGLSEAWFCCAEPTELQLAPLELTVGDQPVPEPVSRST